MARVCVVGSVNIDLVFRAPQLPRPGQTVAGTEFTRGLGGKGANQAVMVARLGARAHFVGCVGGDAEGGHAREVLHAEGLDLAGLATVPGASTGVAAVLVDAGGRNSIVVVPGANGRLTPEHVAAALGDLAAVDAVVAQMETPPEATRAAFTRARAGGVRTILNPAPAGPLPDDLLALVDLLVPNESEASELTGADAFTQRGAEAAARALLARGARAVVLTRGERGALVLDAHGLGHVPAYPVAATDTTGAGDAFVGALAVFLAETSDLTVSVAAAQAAAALSVTRPGAFASFPGRGEVLAFLRERSPA